MSNELTKIRSKLIGLEETIIHHLLERAQFGLNTPAYIPGKIVYTNPEKSFFEESLFEQECLDAKRGRFNDPEERPFSDMSKLPSSIREVNHLKIGMKGNLQIDDYNKVNLTGKILEAYITGLLPKICKGDDGEYGSSVEEDISTLRRIAQRIHYGSFYVAESKYSENTESPKDYTRLITTRDIQGLSKKLRTIRIENDIIERVHTKVESLQKSADKNSRIILDPSVVSDFYRNVIIPLTCEGEIDYFLNRRNLALDEGKYYSFDYVRKKHAVGFGSSPTDINSKMEGEFLHMTAGFYTFRIDGTQKNISGKDMHNIIRV